ncbi:hypothetical protein LSM04_004142 [Trypanosoma melophagium]|uniref:uncharacterized protein n=1 Tax=Trypanosoma melophagium TaxID=715481 RepID=UPI00351A027C|nr:hypothetical protein LSM04_004142 [Trypanosoma melophagium]
MDGRRLASSLSANNLPRHRDEAAGWARANLKSENAPCFFGCRGCFGWLRGFCVRKPNFTAKGVKVFFLAFGPAPAKAWPWRRVCSKIPSETTPLAVISHSLFPTTMN